MTTATAKMLEQFVATGRDADLAAEGCAEGMEGMKLGRVYDECFWTEKQEDGQWWTIIGNQQLTGTLEEMELALYELALSETYM